MLLLLFDAEQLTAAGKSFGLALKGLDFPSMPNRQALADLYDRHAPRLYAIALRITGDRDAAADALEGAFLLLSRSEVDDAGRFLIRVVREAALARQTRTASAAVVPAEVTPKAMIEDVWYGGMSVSELAKRYGVAEGKVRAMLCDGMAALREQFLAGTK